MTRGCSAPTVRLAPLLMAALLAAGGCGLGVSSAPPSMTETEPPTAPVETWPTPTAGQPSEALPSEAPPSAAPSPAPSAVVAPTSVPTPRVTPAPTLPPVTPPWVYEGTLEFVDDDWYHEGAKGSVLANGDVLLVRQDGLMAAVRDARSSAWRIVPGLPAPRGWFGLVALPDGRALAVGGLNAEGVSFSSVYAFDPATEAWRRIGLLNWARTGPGVALLPDGRVLVAGGTFLNGEMRAAAPTAILASHHEEGSGRVELADADPGDGPTPVTVPYATVEIFDPATGTAEMTRPMACARGGPATATLADGRIMVAELADPGCGVAEIYDPATGSFEQTGELPPLDVKVLERQGVPADESGERWLGVPTPLGDGGALLGLGTWSKHSETVYRAFRYHPATNHWTQFGPTAAAVNTDPPARTRSWSLKGAALVALEEGRVFVAGGSIPQDYYSYDGWSGNQVTTRIFDPYTSTWASLPDMPVPMDEPFGLRLADGSVLLIGRPTGSGWWGLPPSALRYDFR